MSMRWPKSAPTALRSRTDPALVLTIHMAVCLLAMGNAFAADSLARRFSALSWRRVDGHSGASFALLGESDRGILRWPAGAVIPRSVSDGFLQAVLLEGTLVSVSGVPVSAPAILSTSAGSKMKCESRTDCLLFTWLVETGSGVRTFLEVERPNATQGRVDQSLELGAADWRQSSTLPVERGVLQGHPVVAWVYGDPFILCRIGPGVAVPGWKHAREDANVLVLSGSLRVDVQGQSPVDEAHDYYGLPSHSSFSLRCVGTEYCIFLATPPANSPPFEK